MIDLSKQLKPESYFVELAEAVLGAIMLDKDAIHTVSTIIDKGAFYVETHNIVYSAMLDLYANQYPIDLLTVTQKLREKKHLESIGGPVYLIELTNKVASSANIEYHCHLLKKDHTKRKIKRTGYDMYIQASEPTGHPDEILQNAQSAIFALTDGATKGIVKTASIAIKEEIERMDAVSKLKDGLIGTPTGIAAFDNAIGGLQQPDLWIIAARPGMGKTALVLSFIHAQVMSGISIAMFSLEMSANQLVQRLISMEAGVPTPIIRDPRKATQQEAQRVQEAIETLSSVQLYLDDTPGISILELSAKCRKLKRDYDVKVIYVDYLQLMSGEAKSKQGNREQEISFISRSLKGLAKELNIPIVALSQLSRDVEKRGGSRRPQLADLRESGSLEQDADNIAFIYRAEYYKIFEDAQGESLRGVAEIIIEKYRNGEPQTVYLNWVSNLTQFRDFPDLENVFSIPPSVIITPEEDLPF